MLAIAIFILISVTVIVVLTTPSSKNEVIKTGAADPVQTEDKSCDQKFSQAAPTKYEMYSIRSSVNFTDSLTINIPENPAWSIGAGDKEAQPYSVEGSHISFGPRQAVWYGIAGHMCQPDFVYITSLEELWRVQMDTYLAEYYHNTSDGTFKRIGNRSVLEIDAPDSRKNSPCTGLVRTWYVPLLDFSGVDFRIDQESCTTRPNDKIVEDVIRTMQVSSESGWKSHFEKSMTKNSQGKNIISNATITRPYRYGDLGRFFDTPPTEMDPVSHFDLHFKVPYNPNWGTKNFAIPASIAEVNAMGPEDNLYFGNMIPTPDAIKREYVIQLAEQHYPDLLTRKINFKKTVHDISYAVVDYASEKVILIHRGQQYLVARNLIHPNDVSELELKVIPTIE